MRNGCQRFSLSLRGMGVSQEFRKVKKTTTDNGIFKILRKKHWKETQQVFLFCFFDIDSSLNHSTLWNFRKSHPNQREVWDPSNQDCLGSSLRFPRIPVGLAFQICCSHFQLFLNFQSHWHLAFLNSSPCSFFKKTPFTHKFGYNRLYWRCRKLVKRGQRRVHISLQRLKFLQPSLPWWISHPPPIYHPSYLVNPLCHSHIPPSAHFLSSSINIHKFLYILM